MASKAKLSLSQFLFRRTGNNNNGSSNNAHSNNDKNEVNVKTNTNVANNNASNVTHSSANNGGVGTEFNVTRHRRISGGGSVSSAGGARQVFYEPQEMLKPTKSMQSLHNKQQVHVSHQNQTPQQKVQQQLQGILKKPGNNGEGGGLGRTHRSSLHRSKSNPNPSNNPLKEVSWSCPTLEKRREVILNYFERIILENKQEQIGQKHSTKQNIPCEGGNGEPIYEEISDFPSSHNSPENNNNRTGSLKPKLGPKKVRMNIPQDHHRNDQSTAGGQPIYDRVLCRSQSMLESSSSSSSSGFYDVAPSTVASLSSSGSHHSLYENFRPSTYYATSTSSASSSDGDYGTVGGGGVYSNNPSGNKTVTTTRIAGRSHSFHDNYRNSGHYNITAPAPSSAPLNSVDTDQLYAKVCKRKKLRVVTNENATDKPQQAAQTQAPTTTAKPGCDDHHGHHHHYRNNNHENELCVQVSCGNVVTMIPVMLPCPSNSVQASSSFSTSCLSLSSSSDNNTDDNMTITTSISSRNHNNNNNGHFHYETEKIIPDKNIAYIKCTRSESFSGGDSCPPSSAAARNRNNLSVIHLLAAYDPAKEIEEFIPSKSSSPTTTAIIDSTDCAPKSISVPVRAGFSSAKGMKNQEKEDEFSVPRQPIMLTNCSFAYDNNAFQPDEENSQDADDEASNQNQQNKNLRRSNSLISSSSNAPTIIIGDTSKDHISSAASAASTSSVADYDSSSASATSDTDTDEDEHHAKKYSFATGNGNGRGASLLKGQTGNNRVVKRITFQDDVTVQGENQAITQDLLVLSTSEESEDDEELCEHKSLLEMNRTVDILDGQGKGMSLMDDEDRGFDSFLEESENSGESKGDSPAGFTAENLRNQRTFAQMTQNVPQEQLKKKAASVLDLINSEISDLHMRELELKKLHSPPPPNGESEGGNGENGKDEMNEGSGEEFEEGSSGEDDFSDSAIEYDGFTTNGSHSSGQVSPSENLNEMISQHRGQRQLVEEENREQDGQGDDEEEEEEQEDEVDHHNKRGIKEVKVRPLEEEEDRSIKFVPTDETPIEREIRLTREREEEFRRNNYSYLAVCPPAPANKTSGGTNSFPIAKARDFSSRPETQSKAEVPLIPGAVSKDVQLEMATARFKREIEESMQREKELIREARQKKVEDEEIEEVTVKEEEKNVEQVTAAPVAPTPPQEPQQPIAPTSPQKPVATPAPAAATPENQSQNQLRKPTIAKLSIAKLPAARFFSPPAFNANKPSRITPVVSPIISKSGFGYPSGNNGSMGSPSMGIARQSYSSIEKYIQHTSMNYMANRDRTMSESSNNGDFTENKPAMGITTKDPGVVNKSLQFSNIPEDPLRIIQKPITPGDEDGEGVKENEEEKPKRRYIPAQDKIHQEIQELAMREKELNRSRAKWKSTLDLPEAMKEAEEEKEPLRRTTSTTQSSLSLNTTASSSLSTSITKRDSVSSGGSNDANNFDDNGESDLSNFTNVTSEDVRQVTRVKAPARRRHSLLINQWEERIRQQQQQNTKK